jgi:phosphate transport system protein
VKQLEDELRKLKTEVTNIWELVIHQLKKTHEAMNTFDKNLARAVMVREERVNSQELKIDRDCENVFALFSPVAVDLRFVLAVLKINNNIERTGDIADGIARFIVDAEAPFKSELLMAIRLEEMFDESTRMVEDTLTAFIQEDTKLARTIFLRDDLLDKINWSLYALSTIRKLERVGDQCKNIAEEIIFYVEAKVMRHVHD